VVARDLGLALRLAGGAPRAPLCAGHHGRLPGITPVIRSRRR